MKYLRKYGPGFAAVPAACVSCPSCRHFAAAVATDLVDLILVVVVVGGKVLRKMGRR